MFLENTYMLTQNDGVEQVPSVCKNKTRLYMYMYDLWHSYLPNYKNNSYIQSHNDLNSWDDT